MFASFGLGLASVVAARPHLNDLRDTVTDALVCTLPKAPRCDRLHHARPALSTTPPHLCHRRQAQRHCTVVGLVARSLAACRLVAGVVLLHLHRLHLLLDCLHLEELRP